MKRIALAVVLVVLGVTAQALAVGHYEMVWFRQWGRSENGQAGGCGVSAVHVLQVWVFDEDGNRMGNVQLRDHNGVYHGWQTAPDGNRAEIELLTTDDWGVQCYDGTSSSDISPVVTVAYGPCYPYYSYDVGFVFKQDGASPGDADSTTWGVVPTRTNGSDDNPYTKSMVYSHQYWPNYFTATAWDLMPNSGSYHQQTFVATGVNRLLGAFLFPVQPGNAPTLWGVEIKYGGPDGPVIYRKNQPIDYYFAQPLAFGTDECPVIRGETYTVTLLSIEPSICNIYYYPGTNYANGDYYFEETINPPDPENPSDPATKDMYGFVWSWDTGTNYGMIICTVSDSNGDPISNATVTLSDGPTAGSGITTTYGVCVLDDLTAGTYTVSVDRPGYEPASSGGHVVQDDAVTLVEFTLSSVTQDLTNGSFEMDTYAWITYGANPPQVWGSPAAGVSANSGSQWLGMISGGAATSGGAYQRVPTLAGETYQGVFNMYGTSAGAQARIGVDLTGGTDPAGGSVDWSPWSTSTGAWSPDSDPDKQRNFAATGLLTTLFLEYSASALSVVALDNVRLFRTSGPAPTADRAFSDGWSLMSAALVDSAGESVPSVLDQLLGAGNVLEGNLFRYDTVGETYDSYSTDFADVDEARGYWMNLSIPAPEGHANPLPSDPVSIPLAVGWNLIGQPHRYGTPLSGLIFEDGQEAAWRNLVEDNKAKFRSDGNPEWAAGWLTGTETAIEWRVWIASAGSLSNQPALKIADVNLVEFRYHPGDGSWQLDSSGTVTSGGISNRVYMSMDAWHVARLYYNQSSNLWRITIDGLTDAAHQMEGTSSSATGNQYVQWGVVSSGSFTDMYTSHVYWGQAGEIDNWPANKKYDAATQAVKDPAIDPGWGTEGGGTESFTSIGAIGKSMHEAALAGWVEEAAVGYDGGYQIVKSAGGDDTSLRAWYGYWLKVNEPGLSLKIPGPAETTAGASDVVSGVRLSLDADGCITGNFMASLSPSASDGYEATRDVAAPPAGPGGQQEVRLGTSLNSELMLLDVRPEPGAGETKVWSCTASGVNFGPSECKNVTVTWDLAGVGAYGYKLVDVSEGISTILTPGGEYVFEICDPEQLLFELHAKEGGFPPETVNIESVQTMGDHGAAGELGLDVDLTASTLPADSPLVTTESREAGITKVVIDCDGDVTLPDPPENLVESIIGVNNGDVTANVLSVTAIADVITINLSALPDQDTYTVTLLGSAIAGDNDFMIRALDGEVDNGGASSQVVNALDLSAVRMNFTADVTVGDNAKYDIVSDGAINALDLSECRIMFTHTAP